MQNVLTMDRQRRLIGELRTRIVRPPHAGGRWEPVEHSKLIEYLLTEVRLRNMVPIDANFQMKNNGLDMNFRVGIGPPGLLRQHGRFLYTIGLRASNSRRSALCYYVGVQNEGNPKEYYILARMKEPQKYTKWFDMDQAIRVLLMFFRREVPAIIQEVGLMKKLRPAQPAELWLKLIEKKILTTPAVRTAACLNSFSYPTYWGLLQYVATAIRKQPPKFQRFDVFNQLFDIYQLLKEDRM